MDQVSGGLRDPDNDYTLWSAKLSTWRFLYRVPTADVAAAILQSQLPESTYWDIGNVDAEGAWQEPPKDGARLGRCPHLQPQAHLLTSAGPGSNKWDSAKMNGRA